MTVFLSCCKNISVFFSVYDFHGSALILALDHFLHFLYEYSDVKNDSGD